MRTIDFPRSFMTWTVDTLVKAPTTVSHKPPFTLNHARIPLDSRLEVVEKRTGRTHSFYQGVNCKTERVGVERDIWTHPNADFVPILSDPWCLFIKSWEHVGKKVMLYPETLGQQPERQVVRHEETFAAVRVNVAYCEGEPLGSAEAIIAAILANRPLVARTELENDRYRATIEYPVKTVNGGPRETIYQTDTGPILYPDLSREPHDLIAGLELAFSAFNAPDWIELLVRVPTPVPGGSSAYHYSKAVRHDARNQLIAVP